MTTIHVPDWKAREGVTLAPWAMHAADSSGRVHEELPHAFRSPYQRDRDRIVHSSAFRRLAHKTQVFTAYPGDYHRSRLTHTLEVTSIARTLARALALNEDLVETLALSHDIGHPPFGHAGEDTLNELLADYGGFSHNAQALRIMTILENRYPMFAGLNLSREVLDSQRSRVRDGSAPPPLLETQVVDAADSIAYDTHDADDAIELQLVTLDEMLDLPLVSEAFNRILARYGTLPQSRLRQAVLHELVEWQVAELVERSLQTLSSLSIDSTEKVLTSQRIIVHSATMAAGKSQLELFLFERVYRSQMVVSVRSPAQQRLKELFHHFVLHPEQMPVGYTARAETLGIPRSVADYLAGMTDGFLEREHALRLS